MRNPEKEEMVRKMKSLVKGLKNMQGLSVQKSVSYSDLCMFPHVHWPVGFKMPKFEKYDGHGDLIAHLKRYCNQLRGAGGKEELLMAYFGESLTGIASEWNSLTNFKKKITESFREYAIKWREQASRVKPPMDEAEMVNVFLQAQEADYFQNMMYAMGKTFAEAIKIGEMVENGLKTGRIISQSTFRATSQAIQNGSRVLANQKKREEGAMMTSALKAIITIVDSEARPKAAVKQAKNEKKITLTPQVAETNTGVAPAKDAILYVPRAPRKEQLMLNTPKRFERRKVTLNVPKLYVPKGIYVARGPVISPRLNEPVVISRAPQSPVRDPTAVPWNYSKTMVTYKWKEIMGEVNEMNQPRKYHNPEEQKMLKLSKDKRFPPKKLVSSEEAEEFFRKMKTSEYAIIDQLRKTPSHVSLLSLFISSNEHQKVLLKTLNEAYVSVETSVEQLERMTGQFFEVNRISFSRDDLPQEGAAHKKALHLTVKCKGYYMKRVMLDSGSGVDICPLSTLQRMKIGTERIRPNNVLDMDTSYNFLLGRPWTHAAGAVPYTLHQMVKFEHENQEIVVYGEDEQSIYRDPSVPCLEAREGSEHIVYQAFKIVIIDQCEERAPFPQPCLSNASVMVTTEMIKHGYKPGKGLGVYLQGIIEPVT
ncbi:uncharacterized protein LOC142168181 [Nicotiana tabacum]|uniref:Uncharacterized protein LOC142168181 n=1 Tax=Nicotiana tabacum TaxID=4097 RepID=A0AC58SIZ5_TOBAC